MEIFPPNNQAAPLTMPESMEKTVMTGLRLMAKMERELQARLKRVTADLDRVLAAFASGGLVASDRVLMLIADRQRRAATRPAGREKRSLRTGEARPERSQNP
jgi:hypothetical protein